jgi:hypothetical protein
MIIGSLGTWRGQAIQNSRLPYKFGRVAGFVEVVEREETLVAEACNHPNCLVLPFSLALIRLAA